MLEIQMQEVKYTAHCCTTYVRTFYMYMYCTVSAASVAVTPTVSLRRAADSEDSSKDLRAQSVTFQHFATKMTPFATSDFF